MAKKIKIITRDIPIYFGYFRIVITKDFQYAVKKLKIKTDNHDVNKFSSFVHTDYKNNISRYTIFINKKLISPSIIAHEAVHLVNAVYLNSLIELDRINDEPQAYLTGWFVNEIHKELNLCNKKSQ